MADFVGSAACPRRSLQDATASTVPRIQGQGRPPGRAMGGQDHDRGRVSFAGNLTDDPRSSTPAASPDGPLTGPSSPRAACRGMGVMNLAGSDHAVFLERCRSARMPAALDGDRVDRSLDQCRCGLLVALWITELGLGMSFGPGQILRTLLARWTVRADLVLDVVIVPLLVWGLVQAFPSPTTTPRACCWSGLRRRGRWGSRLHSSHAPTSTPSPWWWSWRRQTWSRFRCGWRCSCRLGSRCRCGRWFEPCCCWCWPHRRWAWSSRAPTTNSGAPGAVGSAAVDGRAAGGDRHRAGKVCAHRPGRRRGGGPGSVDGRAAGAAAGGPPGRPTRAATSLVTGVRANGPALAIAQASFPSLAAVSMAIVAFAMFSVLLPVSFAIVAGRSGGEGLRRRSEGAMRQA